ncbi:MAG: hypothetical protein CO109_00265, partial [Deltaproteobacteria bacterium CG_4_9_14_3_um_filter_65_9]
GVQGAIRATAPPSPVAAAPAAAPAPASVASPAPLPSTPAEGWTPSSLKKVGQSDKIADELYGVTALDAGADGAVEVVAWGTNILYFYRVKGTEVLPISRITLERKSHLLNVGAADVDGDGRKELLATCLVGDRIRSVVYKKGKDTYAEVAWDIPYFLAVVADASGKQSVVGQARGVDLPFRGKLFRMAWDGKTLKEGEAFPANTNIKPLNEGILGLSAAKLDKEWRWVYTDEESHLRVVDPTGKSVFRSKEKYGSGIDLFEWGAYDRTAGMQPQFFLRKAARVSEGAEGKPILLTYEVDKGILGLARSWDKTRVVLLQWEGGGFFEKAGTKMEGRFFS